MPHQREAGQASHADSNGFLRFLFRTVKKSWLNFLVDVHRADSGLTGTARNVPETRLEKLTLRTSIFGFGLAAFLKIVPSKPCEGKRL